MQPTVRTQFSMVARSLEFARNYPSDDVGYTEIVHRLEEGVARMDVIAARERDRRGGDRAANMRRIEFRKTMHERLIRHLSRVSSLAALTHKELAGAFVVPRTNIPHRDFLAAAQAMLASALEHQELLAPFGLGKTLIPELTSAVEEFDAMTTESHAGPHDLATLAGECVALIAMLDALMLARFAGEPRILDAWVAVRTEAEPQDVGGVRAA